MKNWKKKVFFLDWISDFVNNQFKSNWTELCCVFEIIKKLVTSSNIKEPAWIRNLFTIVIFLEIIKLSLTYYNLNVYFELCYELMFAVDI